MTAPGPVRPDRLTILAFLAVVVLGGSNAIAVKATVAELDPIWSAALRFLAAGVILLAFVAATRRAIPRGRSFSGAILYGLLGFAGSYAAIYVAIRDVPAGTVMVLIALTPLFTFGLAILHGLERFRLQGLVGALVALAGVAIVVADQLSAAVPLGPILLVLVGVVFIAESAVILKWVPRADPFSSNAVGMLAGGAALALLSAIRGETFAVPVAPEVWAATAYLVAGGSIAMFGLYLFALRRWTASAVSYVTLLMPMVTVPLAAVLFSEAISVSFLVGGAVVLAGVYVGAFLRIRPRRSSAIAAPECLPTDACAEPAQPAREPARS